MTILDGKALSEKIVDEISTQVKRLKAQGRRVPGLGVVLVGDDPASHTYVKMKEKTCQRVGFLSKVVRLQENTTQKELLNTVRAMNEDDTIDGILVQLPLPPHLDTTEILESINPSKDVDGFHPYNFGRLVQGLESFVPCTPLGVIELLKEYGIDPKGLDCCVVGASNIVGKPMAALLLNSFATVDVCHIYTKDLKRHTLCADMVIVGVGKKGLIKEDMVKEGAIVVDIGINKLSNGKIVGDVDFDNVSKKCSYITPVPGGVGPMTIAMLMKNTLKAYYNLTRSKDTV